jgi:hypothetical protein
LGSRETTMHVTLTWSGPYLFSDIVRGQIVDSAFHGHGVYVWTDVARRCVAYVGKVDKLTIQERLFREYVEGIGGLSRVPAPGETRYEWEMSRTDPHVLNTITNVENFVQVIRTAFAYMSNYRVYVASLAGHSKEVIRDVERHFLCELNPRDTKNRRRPIQELVIQTSPYPWAADLLPNNAMQATCEDARA